MARALDPLISDEERDECEAGSEAMRDYLERSPRGRYGRHRYATEDFGLRPGEIRERFADYTKRFEITEEA